MKPKKNLLRKYKKVKGKISIFECNVKAPEQFPSHHYSWKQFAKYIKAKGFHSGLKESAGYFVRGYVDGKRNDKHLKYCSVAIVDIDLPPLPKKKQILKACKRSKLACIAHSSFTQGRARIIIRTTPYPPELTQHAQNLAYAAIQSTGLKIPPVTETKTKSQPWFLPSDNGRGDGWIKIFQGKPLTITKPKLKSKHKYKFEVPSSNPTVEFIEGLKKGTIHSNVRSLIGYKIVRDDTPLKNIRKDVDALIRKYCTNKKRTREWFEFEGDKLFAWFLKQIDEDNPLQDISMTDLKAIKSKIQQTAGAKVLIKGICKQQTVAVLCAPPNAGKSALLFYWAAPDLAEQGYKVTYIDADSSASDHLVMSEFAEAKGFLWLNPFAPYELPNGERLTPDEFLEIVLRDARGKGNVIIIDTLKKFADLMQKDKLKKFFVKMREFTTSGGSVIIASHTNKYTMPDGRWKFEGTNEIESECDMLSYFYRTPKEKSEDHYVISVYSDKTRGDVGDASFRVKVVPDYTSVNVGNMIRMNDEFVDVRALYEPVTEKRNVIMKEVLDAFDAYCAGAESDEEGYVVMMDAAQSIGKEIGKGVKAILQALRNDKFFMYRRKGSTGKKMIKRLQRIKVRKKES